MKSWDLSLQLKNKKIKREAKSHSFSYKHGHFLFDVVVVDERFTSVIWAGIDTMQTYQGLVSKCLPR